MIKLTITKKKDGSFDPKDGGEKVVYFWYNAERDSDGVNFQFGSKDGSYEVGDDLELELEKYETSNGRIAWREVRRDE